MLWSHIFQKLVDVILSQEPVFPTNVSGRRMEVIVTGNLIIYRILDIAHPVRW